MNTKAASRRLADAISTLYELSETADALRDHLEECVQQGLDDCPDNPHHAALELVSADEAVSLLRGQVEDIIQELS